MTILLSRVANTKEVKAIELTIEEFCEDLEMLRWKEGIERFKIIESFPQNETKTYEVENLQIEMEDQIVVCGDAKDVINANNSVLIAFLESSVAVYKIYKKDKTCYELDFIDGQVFIEAI